jgi:TolB-like protein/class 3 adenylate cyclase
LSGERVKRRLAAVLAANVAGYSRLMGADEEGTLARLKAARKALVDPAIASHHGRIVKTTGDGMLVEFASAVDAVRSAVEIQRNMSAQNTEVPQDTRIEFRIGIHVGDIIFDDNDIFGDGVNIAARLESIADAGGICISAFTHEQVRGNVPVDFADLGEQVLKNIARPVRAYSVALNRPGSAVPRGSLAPSQATAPRLSIVVLPFINIGADSEQDYFVDGVTESLTTDLSRISGAFVIARNTAFSYKGQTPDIRQVGRELSVRYVLEGSVQRGGKRLRVNVQLIDAENGSHIWADRFEKPIADLFELQDEIVSQLANTLQGELIAIEARRAERSAHPDAMDLYFQGWAYLNRGINPEYNAQARALFARAISIDPNCVEALVGSSIADRQCAVNSFTGDSAVRMKAAETAANRALSLAPNHARAHGALGGAYVFSDRVELGMAECERAVALDRNHAVAHAIIGLAKYFIGRGAETEVHIGEALRVSPRDTDAYAWICFAGISKLWLGADAQAVAWLRRSIEVNRNYPLAHFYLGAALAHLGDMAEARLAVLTGLALHPSFTISRYRDSASCSHPAYLAGRERTNEGLRRAGVPEQ